MFYGQVELLGSRVCPRRLFSLCGLVEHGEPVYLLVDAAVDVNYFLSKIGIIV